MSDIVERLRSEADAHADGDWSDRVIRKHFTDAADEIERLREQNEALQALYEQRRDLLRSCDTEVRRLRADLAAATPQEDDRAE